MIMLNTMPTDQLKVVDERRFLRSATAVVLGAALACSAATSLNILPGKRLFSDEYVYALISVGQFPGEPFTDDPRRPSHRTFWSSNSISKVRFANHLETSNMFLYECLLFLVIKLTHSTNSLILGIPGLVSVSIAAVVLYRSVLSLRQDKLQALAAATLFVTNPHVFRWSVEFRGYGLALMLTLVVLYLTLGVITRRQTSPGRDLLFLICATGAIFAHYNTAPYVLVCWLVVLLLRKGGRGRTVAGLLVWCAIIALWMWAGAFRSVTSPDRYRAIVIAMQEPNNWFALTPRNLAFVLSNLVTHFVGLSLFEGFRFRYQAFTVLLGCVCFGAWLRFALGRRSRPSSVNIFLLAYIGVPFACASFAALIGGAITPFGWGYQLWSIPPLIIMFLDVLWSLKREFLRLAVLVVVATSCAVTIGRYNWSKRPNPYNDLLARLRAGDVKEVTLPNYYDAQFLFFQAGPQPQSWPTLKVDPDCPHCVKSKFVVPAWDSVGRLASQGEHSYVHPRPIVLSLTNGQQVEIEAPRIFERAY